MNDDMAQERRCDQRLQIEIPIHLRWRDKDGEIHEEDTLSVNVSTRGAYFPLECKIENTQAMQLTMGVPNKFYGLLPSAMLKAGAHVVRIESLQINDNMYENRTGIAVAFDSPPQLDFEAHLH